MQIKNLRQHILNSCSLQIFRMNLAKSYRSLISSDATTAAPTLASSTLTSTESSWWVDTFLVLFGPLWAIWDHFEQLSVGFGQHWFCLMWLNHIWSALHFNQLYFLNVLCDLIASHNLKSDGIWTHNFFWTHIMEKIPLEFAFMRSRASRKQSQSFMRTTQSDLFVGSLDSVLKLCPLSQRHSHALSINRLIGSRNYSW